MHTYWWPWWCHTTEDLLLVKLYPAAPSLLPPASLPGVTWQSVGGGESLAGQEESGLVSACQWHSQGPEPPAQLAVTGELCLPLSGTIFRKRQPARGHLTTPVSQSQASSGSGPTNQPPAEEQLSFSCSYSFKYSQQLFTSQITNKLAGSQLLVLHFNICTFQYFAIILIFCNVNIISIFYHINIHSTWHCERKELITFSPA